MDRISSISGESESGRANSKHVNNVSHTAGTNGDVVKQQYPNNKRQTYINSKTYQCICDSASYESKMFHTHQSSNGTFSSVGKKMDAFLQLFSMFRSFQTVQDIESFCQFLTYEGILKTNKFLFRWIYHLPSSQDFIQLQWYTIAIGLAGFKGNEM